MSFKTKVIRRDREENYKVLTEEDIAILKIYAANTRATWFIKETPLELKSHIHPHIVVVCDHNIPLLPIGMSSRQNLSEKC